MTTLLTSSSDTRTASIMPRAAHALTALHDIVASGRPVRAALVGGAGSGKTDALRFIQTQLEADDRPVRLLSARDRISAVPDDVALLVDDAHTLDPARLSQLLDRAHRPDAALVIAYRTWPASSELMELTRAVERTAPAVLLGEITLAELRELLPDASAECEDRILEATGGLAWLVFECVQAHAGLSYEGGDCGDEAAHADVTRTVQRRIAHRLETVSPRLRRRIEALSLGLGDTDDDRDSRGELVAEGHAEGLLLHNGRPAPLVAMAARAGIPVDRLVDLVESGELDLVPGSDVAASLDGLVDPALGDRLAARGRREIARDPKLAVTLFEYALRCGADPQALAAAHAHALWAAGEVDAAGALLDELTSASGYADPSRPEHDLLADAVAATWADRGMMSLAHQSYVAVPPAAPRRRHAGSRDSGRRRAGRPERGSGHGCLVRGRLGAVCPRCGAAALGTGPARLPLDDSDAGRPRRPASGFRAVHGEQGRLAGHRAAGRRRRDRRRRHGRCRCGAGHPGGRPAQPPGRRALARTPSAVERLARAAAGAAR